MSDAHRIVKRKPYLDKSLRISKPQEIAPGTSHVCRGTHWLFALKGKVLQVMSCCSCSRGRWGIFWGKADVGICFLMGPESTDLWGDRNLDSQALGLLVFLGRWDHINTLWALHPALSASATARREMPNIVTSIAKCGSQWASRDAGETPRARIHRQGQKMLHQSQSLSWRTQDMNAVKRQCANPSRKLNTSSWALLMLSFQKSPRLQW